MKRAHNQLSSSTILPGQEQRTTTPQADSQLQGNPPQMRQGDQTQANTRHDNSAGPANMAGAPPSASPAPITAHTYPAYISQPNAGNSMKNLIVVASSQVQRKQAIFRQALENRDAATCISMAKDDPSLLSLRSESGNTVMLLAADYYHAEEMNEMLNKLPVTHRQQLAEMVNIKGETALMSLAKNGNEHFIERFFKNIPNPIQLLRMVNKNHESALMIAAKFGGHRWIGALLDGASKEYWEELVQMVNINGESALRVALSGSDFPVIAALINAVPELSLELETEINNLKSASKLLFAAAEWDYENTITTVFNMVPEQHRQQLAEMVDIEGNSALMVAAQSDSNKAIAALFNAVPNPQQLALIRNQIGKTALMIAIDENGNITEDAMIAILNEAPNPNQLIEQIDFDGLTTLMSATDAGATVIPELLKSMPMPNRQQLAQKVSKNGMTALMIAVKEEVAGGITELLKAVPYPDQLAQMVDGNGETALMVVARTNDYEMVTELLNGVRDPDALVLQTDRDGNSALRLALMKNNRKCVVAIVKALKNPMEILRLSGPDDLTTLEFAAQNGFPDLMEIAVKGANQ